MTGQTLPMDDPTPEQVQEALDTLIQLPRAIPVLNAGMLPLEIISAGRESEKYENDSDFHILVDMVHGLLTTIKEVEEVLAVEEARRS